MREDLFPYKTGAQELAWIYTGKVVERLNFYQALFFLADVVTHASAIMASAFGLKSWGVAKAQSKLLQD